jgi:FkbM family methyltransferase
MLARMRIGRTRFVRRVAPLGHERLLAFERLRRRNPLVRALVAPVRWWFRRGSVRVDAGFGQAAGIAQGLRLSMAHIPISHAHAGLLASGLLELSVQEAMKRLLAHGDVFYDVGANIGFFALAGARHVGPSGAAYAFEPVPENAAAIRASAELNALANLEVIERAVGRAAGRDRLLLVEDLSWSHLERQGRHPRTLDTVEVEVVAIDDLVADGRLRPPQLVKIDVEGTEIEVLAGMRKTIEQHRPAIVCELHETGGAFVETMEALGYETTNLDAKQPLIDAPVSAHALALPR